MDIRRWLDDTADREPPDRSDHIGIPEKFREDQPRHEPIVQSFRYKRKRGSSDSSIIAYRRKHGEGELTGPSRSSRVAQRKHPADRLRAVSSDSRSSSQESVAPVKTYERRARHKTRADLYEPKAKRQKKDRSARKDDKSKRTRRKPRDDGARTTGVVQNFHLKGGPKSGRLTLKPETSVGLFKHGRASAQITGRGSGLPDLVFNEMRFLQKPAEHQDEAGRQNEPVPTREDSTRPAQGGQVSTHCEAKLPGGASRRVHCDQDAHRPRPNNVASAKPSKGTDHAKSVVDLPEKPFLGFGSRGARLMSKAGSQEEGSCYTWSESVVPHPAPRIAQTNELNQTHRSATPQLRSGRGSYVSRNPIAHRKFAKQETRRDPEFGPHNSGIRPVRRLGAAAVENDQPKTTVPQDRGELTPMHQTTSQSLPRYPSSPPPQIFERKGSGAISGAAQDRSYHTSDILNIRGAPVGTFDAEPPFYSQHGDHDKENHNPMSSLSIDRAIRQANGAAAMPRFQSPPEKASREACGGNLPHIRRVNAIKHTPIFKQSEGFNERQHAKPLPLWRPSDPSMTQSIPPAFRHDIPNAGRQRWEAAAVEALASGSPHISHCQEPLDFMNESRFEQFSAIDPASEHDYEDWEKKWIEGSVSYDRSFQPQSSLHEAQFNDGSHRRTASALSKTEVTGSLPRRRLLVDHGLGRERVHLRRKEPVDHEPAGFWKPNILY